MGGFQTKLGDSQVHDVVEVESTGVLSDSLVNGKHRRTWPSLDGNSEMDIDSDCDEEVGGRITVCIGDIHGNLAKLEKLWKNLEKHIGPGPFNYCSFIFLGDYCDRGPNTKGALEFLSTLKYRYPYQNHAFIAGNHDIGMAAFLGVLPEAPPGFNMSETWGSNAASKKKRDGWWTGPGVQDMHIQGRRWGGMIYEKGNSAFDSKSTFESYGVPFGDRKKLLAAVPDHHKQFLRDLKWVHEAQGPFTGEYVGIIAVHAGLETNGSVMKQLQILRSRDVTIPRLENFSGRHTVWEAPEETKRYNVLVVSGHHGVLDVESKNRLIVDEGGGWPQNPLTAVILPSRTVIRDTETNLSKKKFKKSSKR